MVDQCELELPTGRVRLQVPLGGAGVMSAFKDLQQQPLEGLDAPYLHAGNLLAAAGVGGVTARTDQAITRWRNNKRPLRPTEWDAGAAIRMPRARDKWWRLDYCVAALRETGKDALTRQLLLPRLFTGTADAAPAAVLRYVRANPAELVRAVPQKATYSLSCGGSLWRLRFLWGACKSSGRLRPPRARQTAG